MNKIKLQELKDKLLKEEVFDCLKSNIDNYKFPIKQQKIKKVKKNFGRKKRKYIIPQKIRLKYKEYIKSKYWKARRKRYYLFNKKECVVCKGKWKIGLHHLKYGNWGNEEDKDLVPLCWKCHSNYHEKYGTKKLRDNTNEFIIQESEINALREITKNL